MTRNKCPKRSRAPSARRKGVRKGAGPPFPFLDSFGSVTRATLFFNGQGYRYRFSCRTTSKSVLFYDNLLVVFIKLKIIENSKPLAHHLSLSPFHCFDRRVGGRGLGLISFPSYSLTRKEMFMDSFQFCC